MILDIISVISQDLTIVKQSNNIFTTIQHDSLKIYPNENRFWWFSQDIGGDAIAWLKIYREYSDDDIQEFIDSNEYEELDVTGKFRQLWNNSYSDMGIEPRQLFGRKEYHPYIASRNVNEETAKKYQLEVINDCIAIPVHNFNRERIGVVLRSLTTNEQNKKYRKIMKEKQPLLWPISEWQRAKVDSKVVIFEGAWGVMRFHQIVQNDNYIFLCLFGVATPSALKEYLNGLDNVIFILDNDPTGIEMGKRINSINSKWRCISPTIYPDEMTDKQIIKLMEHIA